MNHEPQDNDGWEGETWLDVLEVMLAVIGCAMLVIGVLVMLG